MDPMETDFSDSDLPEIRYGLLFEEGAGYLWCKRLGAGSQGSAAVVRKLHPLDDNDKVYVRKKTNPYDVRSELIEDRRSRWTEVSSYREHPNIPRLVSWVEYRLLQKAVDYRLLHNIRQTSMIFDYCNGLDVRGWVYFFHTHVHRPAPVEFLIKLIHGLCEAINNLHNTPNNPIAHCDLIEANMFSHFPDEETNVPTFLIGDLGYSKALSTHPISHPGKVNRDDWIKLHGDIISLYCTIATVITGKSFGDSGVARRALKKLEGGIYTPGTRYPAQVQVVVYLLDQFMANSYKYEFKNESVVADWNQIMSCIGSEVSVIDDKKPDLAWLREGLRRELADGEPLLFDTPDDIYELATGIQEDQLPPGPWRVAAVDVDTLQVLEVDTAYWKVPDPLDEDSDDHYTFNDCATRPIIMRQVPTSFRGV